MIPPVGYDFWTTYLTLRVLAERLADRGHTVLRVHFEGTGDSAGSQWELEQMSTWRRTIVAGAAELRNLGCGQVTAVGVGVGAALGMVDASACDLSAVAAWVPVVSGRRHARQLKMLSEPVPACDEHPEGARAYAGTVLSAQTMSEIAALDLTTLTVAPPRVLLVGDGSHTALAEHLTAIGADVERREDPDRDDAIGRTTEESGIAASVVDHVAEFLGDAPAADAHLVRGRPAAAFDGILEEVCTLGENQLTGILTSPVGQDPTGTTVVLLNSGSEVHVGPGRAWVEWARHLAGQGHRCLRVDFRGWGESPFDGREPGRAYAPHTIDDTVELIRTLRRDGHDHIVVAGVCAGAWIAMRAVLQEPADGVLALNPQMSWRPGLPIFARINDWVSWRAPSREEEASGRRDGRWDTLGRRDTCWTAQWIDDLDASGVPVALVFSGGDDGLVHLRDRVARRLSDVTERGRMTVVEVDDIDHAMHMAWRRPALFAACDDVLTDGLLSPTSLSRSTAT